MDPLTDPRHRAPRYLAAAPQYARQLVASLMEDPGKVPDPPDAETANAGIVWLGQLLFTMALGAGADPRDHTHIVLGDHRGAVLARSFLDSGTVEVCCDYCGSLMVEEIARAVVRVMTAWHGPLALAQWQALTGAALPPLRMVGEPPTPPVPDARLNGDHGDLPIP